MSIIPISGIKSTSSFRKREFAQIANCKERNYRVVSVPVPFLDPMAKTPARAKKKVEKPSDSFDKTILADDKPHGRSMNDFAETAPSERDLDLAGDSEGESGSDRSSVADDDALNPPHGDAEEAKRLAKNEKKRARQLALAKRFGEKLAKRGVVYMSRVPPYMRLI